MAVRTREIAPWFLFKRSTGVAQSPTFTRIGRKMPARSAVTDRLKGATDDRVNGATKSGSFSLLDGVNYLSFFALFQVVVFVPWGQFFGER